MLAHADRKDNPCGLCGNTFKTAPELKAHLRVHEEDDVKYTHCCELCGKRYVISFCEQSCSKIGRPCEPKLPDRVRSFPLNVADVF